MFAPLHWLALTPQAKRDLQLLGVSLQYAQVELHQVPANDRIGIVQRQPVVQALQQLRTGVAIFKVEVDASGIAVGRAEHVHLALTAAFQGNRVQLAALGGLDVERYQFQPRAVVGCGL
ncbi:hypothetical protein D3C80_1575780 [compost metagenome]